MLTMTAEQIRESLGQYLTKPLEVTTGTLSTQQTISATSLATGGLSGSFIIKNNGNISVYNSNGKLSVYLGL